MKKKSLLILPCLSLGWLLAFTQRCLAFTFKNATEFTGQTATQTGLKQGDFSAFVATIINLMIGLAGIFFVALFFYGGITWMMAANNSDKIGKAKKIITYAIIGIIFVASAYIISYAISSVFG